MSEERAVWMSASVASVESGWNHENATRATSSLTTLAAAPTVTEHSGWTVGEGTLLQRRSPKELRRAAPDHFASGLRSRTPAVWRVADNVYSMS